jgi:Putative rhamnosyl transferase
MWLSAKSCVMSETLASPMLIATRFGLGIEDPAWFRHRIALLSSITAPSLMAQDDQRFEWVVFVDSGLPSAVRDELAKVLAQFEGRAYMDSKGHTADNLLALARNRGLVGDDEYLLTGRIDDDDAWDRCTISAVRKRLTSWRERCDSSRGFGMTFETGFVWIMYDMLDIDHLQKEGASVIRKAAVRPYSYPFTSISGFVYSSLSDGLTSISTGHPKLPELLAEEKFSVESIATDRPMWLYCRHKQTTSPIRRAAEVDSVNVALVELAEQFGIDAAKVSRYTTSVDRYSYSRIGHWEHRSKLRSALKAANQKMADPLADESEVAALRGESERLAEELRILSENVMCRPEEIGKPRQSN